MAASVPARSSGPGATSAPQIKFVTLGMVVLDDILYGDEEESPYESVIGGSGTYSTFGARLFCSDPKTIGWVIRAGLSFPPAMYEELKTWGTTMTRAHVATFAVTRARLRYEYSWGHVRRLQSLRRQAGITEAPLVIWEPQPSECLPRNLKEHLDIASCLVNVFSPNHWELSQLFGVEWKLWEMRDNQIDRKLIEDMAKRFIDKGIGQDNNGWIVVRAGQHGCMFWGRKRARPVWLPPYYRGTRNKLLDSTGAGSAFLGALALGLVQTGDIEEAAMWGTVAASFAMEQSGLPELNVVDGKEEWCDDEAGARLVRYKSRRRVDFRPHSWPETTTATRPDISRD
ncbi:hypothetical protein ABW21_db0200415 [Orbilia brochopaga]|nr:hypothetical protein ABW21_db0200415 [Drechslerella brochopaga]